MDPIILVTLVTLSLVTFFALIGLIIFIVKYYLNNYKNNNQRNGSQSSVPWLDPLSIWTPDSPILSIGCSIGDRSNSIDSSNQSDILSSSILRNKSLSLLNFELPTPIELQSPSTTVGQL